MDVDVGSRVIDVSVLDELRVAVGGDEGEALVREVIDLFTREAPIQMAAVRAAAERGDFATLAVVAQRLAVSGGDLGASPLAEAAARVAAAARDRRRSDALTGVPALLALTEVSLAELQRWQPG